MLWKPAFVALTIATAQGGALAAASPAAEADSARKKPLQRCDQLSDKAEIECLKKARERIVEARKKREASAQGEPQTASGK